MQQITLQDFFQLCSFVNPTQLLILMFLSDSPHSEVWVSEDAIAKKLNIHIKTVQRSIKKMEGLNFLSVKRSPKTHDPKAREVNKYSLNYDTIRKTIQKKAFNFDSGLTQLIEQVQSGTGNQKFRDFLVRRKLVDSAGNIDLDGLSSIGTTLAEIAQAMNSDSSMTDTQTQFEPEELLDLSDPPDEYSGQNADRRHLCPGVKELFLRVHSGDITHPGAVNFFRQECFKGLWDDPDSAEAAKTAAQDLGELSINGVEAVVQYIRLHYLDEGEGKFQPDL